ncbi:DUF334 domain-containing protein [Staphylococcus warneri]|uniref:DUF334 domain-containing protein n=1 Tax=Staphylococcus warneri TaxID=1292 RepID=UPI001678D789|nr:DUF334 domain-containing protein [Staphylococcus warneri]
MNSEIKKDSYNLSKEDRSRFTAIYNSMEQINNRQATIIKQQNQWLKNAKLQIKHEMEINDYSWLQDSMARQIHQEIAPKIIKTFEEQTEIMKKNNNEIENQYKKINKTFDKYKKIFITSMIAFFAIAVAVVLLTSITNGAFEFFGVQDMYSAITTKMKHAQGFMTVVWFLIYFVPVLIWSGIVIGIIKAGQIMLR